MTTEQLNTLAQNALFVDALAQRVVEKLLARMKQALVVYTGSDIGQDAALASMKRLKAEGFTFRVLFSRSAAKLLDVERIRSELEPEELWIETPEETPEALTARYDTIIVPAATVRTAAHVSACMADTPAAAVILDGLMRGKNVILNLDGCCPENKERARRGFRMTEPLKETLSKNLETLRAYGARLTTSDRLYESTMRTFRAGVSAGKKEERKSAPGPVTTGQIRLNCHVVSGQQLASCPSNSVVLVERNALITQLAADDARRRGISIRKEL